MRTINTLVGLVFSVLSAPIEKGGGSSSGSGQNEEFASEESTVLDRPILSESDAVTAETRFMPDAFVESCDDGTGHYKKQCVINEVLGLDEAIIKYGWVDGLFGLIDLMKLQEAGFDQAELAEYVNTHRRELGYSTQDVYGNPF